MGSAWSPDGTQIAYISCHRAREDADKRTCSLFTIAANGAGPRKLVDSVQATGPLAWSPDGRKIAFFGHERDQLGEWPRDNYIYIVDRDGSNLTRLAEASSPPTWSPDGSAIAFLRGDDRDSLFVVNPDGSGLRKLADLDPASMQERSWYGDPHLSWSPDGSVILLQDYPFILVKADGPVDPEGGSPYAVFAGPEAWVIAYASWAPDGSKIAIAVEQTDEYGPNYGDAILLTMARDGSGMRVLVGLKRGIGHYAVPNEPWDEEGEWVWHSP